MSEILAPCLELLRRLADILAKPDKGISEAMRVEVRQAGPFKCLPEDRANGGCRSPVPPVHA